jgi:hypothetical protein
MERTRTQVPQWGTLKLFPSFPDRGHSRNLQHAPNLQQASAASIQSAIPATQHPSNLQQHFSNTPSMQGHQAGVEAAYRAVYPFRPLQACFYPTV